MTWKERQTLTVLSSILGILFAILLIVLGIRYRENRVEPEIPQEVEVEIPTIVDEKAYFSGLTYHNGKTTLTFSLDENGHWIWSDDPTFPLDDSTVLSILAVLEDWQPLRTLEGEDAVRDAELWRPTATLTATTSEGMVVTLLFGKAVDEGTAHYVRVNNETTRIHVVPDEVYNLLCVPIFDMMRLPELPALTESVLDSVEITSLVTNTVQPSLLIAMRVQGDPTAPVSWRHAGANVTLEPITQRLVNEWAALSLKKCVLYRPSEAAVSICGLESPEATIRFTWQEDGESAALDLTVGGAAADGSGYYVRINEDPTIFLVDTLALKASLAVSLLGLEGAAEMLAIMEG